MNALWDWATRAWAAPGVAEAALSLQDHQGQNPPLLLWAGWCARTGRPLDDETLEAASDTARAWNGTVVAPLRAVRRTLKTPIPDLEDAARLAVRDQVKAVELAAERHLLEALEALAGPPGAPRPPVEALAAAARAWDRTVPRAGLQRLAALLPA